MLYPSKERIISFNILQAVNSGKKLDEQISLLASHETRKNQIFNLCYGVIRHNNKLEFYIRSKAKKAVSKRTNIILKLSLYELAYNNSSKPYAVVSEALKLMDYLKEAGAKPFVNAILSGFLRSAEKEKKILDSYPWFPEHINAEIKKVFLDDSRQVIDNLSSIKPFFLLVNETKISINELHKRLIEEGIEAEPIEYKGVNSIRTFDRKIFNSKEFEQGYFIVQDLSSQYAVHLLNVNKEMEILDLCSAPGGKAIKTAILCNDKAKITAVDRSPARSLRLHENINRLGINSISIINEDVTTLEIEAGTYDRVLVDPPCSALGVLARNPDIAIREDLSNWEKLPQLQKSILVKGLTALKKGGHLLYSVCTFRKEETIEVISSAIQEIGALDKKMECLTIPNDVNMDGLYIAILEKK